MRAPQDQCIDAVFQQVIKIPQDNFVGDAVMNPSFLYQRYKHRTSLSKYSDLRIDPVYHVRIFHGVNRRARRNDTHFLIRSSLHCHLRSGFDNADHRYPRHLADLIDSKRCRGITRDYDGLDILCFQEPNDLP